MEPLLPLLVGAVVAAIASLLAAARRKARVRGWRAAARAAGLSEVEETESLFTRSLRGRAGLLRVRLEGYRRGKHESGTRIVIDGLNHGIGGLSLRGEGLGTAFEKMVGEREIEIGDEDFDREAYVQGRAPLARALLDPEARRGLRSLVQGRVEVPGREPVAVRVHLADGILTAELRERWLTDRPLREHWLTTRPETLPAVLVGLLALAQRLIVPPDVAARIAENLAREPIAGVRLGGLRTLIEEFPQHPATREALLAARQDPSDEIRLRAGLALGEDGREVLLELAAKEASDDPSAARAVAALGEHLPLEQAVAILQRSLRARRPATARACLALLGRFGGQAGVQQLAKVLALETGELGVAAARALAEGGQPSAEAPLVEALRSAAAAVRAAAAQALGRSASVAAVQPLRAAVADDPDGTVRRDARQAIAEIQSRLSGAAPGQLSLARGTAGELSLADGAPGSLSLADTDEATVAPPAVDAEPVALAAGQPRRGEMA